MQTATHLLAGFGEGTCLEMQTTSAYVMVEREEEREMGRECSCVNLPAPNFIYRSPESCCYLVAMATVSENYFTNHREEENLKNAKQQRLLRQLVEQGWQACNSSYHVIAGDFAFNPLDGGRTIKAHQQTICLKPLALSVVPLTSILMIISICFGQHRDIMFH